MILNKEIKPDFTTIMLITNFVAFVKYYASDIVTKDFNFDLVVILMINFGFLLFKSIKDKNSTNIFLSIVFFTISILFLLVLIEK